MGLGIKFGIWAIAAIAVLSAIGLAYNHYTGLIEENATLKTNVGQLETALSVQKEANKAQLERIDEFAKAFDRQAETMQRLADFSDEASQTVRRINDVFASHDFQRLLDKKPGLVVRRVNDGSADTLRMFECATAPGGCEAAGSTAPNN